MHVFLLAQEGEPLLSHVHGEDHKQTQNQHHKEESCHARRIAWSPESVLYRRFADAKQLCKACFRLRHWEIFRLHPVNPIFPPC